MLWYLFQSNKKHMVSGGFSQNIHPKSGTGSANLALLLGRFPEDTIEEIGRVVLAPIKKQTQGPRDPVSWGIEESVEHCEELGEKNPTIVGYS